MILENLSIFNYLYGIAFVNSLKLLLVSIPYTLSLFIFNYLFQHILEKVLQYIS